MGIPAIERKNILNLFPYFNQKHPVVIDAGSNKGDWSSMIAANVGELHLFEPNLMLLHYSMVRFCDLDNVLYNDLAVSNKNGKAEFIYFTNSNNGLSNIIGNDTFKDLPFKKKVVHTISLDTYINKYIDFLKIDVEGADLLVLQGAERLLTEKRFKFIQVEKADHMNVIGQTFQDVLTYLKQFGYVPMQSDDNENVIFMQEGFTQDWNNEFKKNTKGIKCDFALEIGAFEGLTSRYICDNLLRPNSRMICIDPLTDEYLPGHEDNNLFVGQYDRFIRNTKGYPIELLRMTSDEAFANEVFLHYRFDFIYIDGDHREKSVYKDGVNAFLVCKVGGHILFDDYEWREETKNGIDRFLNEYKGLYELVIKDYQVMIRKTNNKNAD